MRISLKTVMESLPPEQRTRVEKRAAELIAEDLISTIEEKNMLVRKKSKVLLFCHRRKVR
jgi:hypothetical protein